MKNFNDTIGNRNRDLLARNAVPQLTASPRAPNLESMFHLFFCVRYVPYPF